MNLNQLYYFAASAKHQHYTRAAEELFISQPSLSHAIASLEAELGTELFEKRGRNVVLTEHGRIFLTHVERALAEIEQGKTEIARLTGAEAGHISIAYPTPMATRYLPALISQFLEIPENIGTHFTLSRDNTDALIEGLKARKYDIAFLPMALKDPDLEIIPLFTEQVMALMPENHPLAQCESLSAEMLKGYTLLEYEGGSKSPEAAQRLNFPKFGDLDPAFRTDDNNLLHDMVQQGFGIALTMPLPNLEEMHLCAVPLNDPRYLLDVGIAYAKDRYMPPVIARFLEAIRQDAIRRKSE